MEKLPHGRFENLPAMAGVDPAAVAAAEGAKARIQSAYLVALQKPRNENQARSRILDHCKQIEFAESVEYEKPVGGDNKAKGLSIRYTEVALKEWGNVLSSVNVVYEDEFSKRLRVDCLDLESNTTFGRDITINKTVERRSGKNRDVIGQRFNTYGDKVFIVRATEDELITKENALISKAIRNEGLRLLPPDIKEESIKVARETVNQNIKENFQQAKKSIFDGFSNIGVWPKDLEAYLEHSLDNISPFELDTLRKVFTAIKTGESSWIDFVRAKQREDDDDDDNAEKRLRGKQPPKKPPKKPAKKKPAASKKQPKGQTDSGKAGPKGKKTPSSTGKDENVQSRPNDAVDITQTDEFQLLGVYSKKYPEVYKEKTKGNPLKTVADLIAAIAKIEAVVGEGEDGAAGPPDA